MPKSEDDFYRELALISDETITHELEIRNVDANRGPLVNRRKQLARELFNEQINSNIQFTMVVSPLNDLKVCKSMIDKYEVELNDLTSTSDMRQKAIANLEFIEKIIIRVDCTSDQESDLAKLLLKAIKTLTDTANGGARSKTQTTPITFPQQTQSTNVLPHANSNRNQRQNNTNTNNDSNSTSGQNSQQFDAIARRFNGDKQADVFEFLRTIKSKAQANHVSDDELMNSAAEFFSGCAAKWFYAQTFRNWTDLSEKLVSDFVQVNYFDELIDTIRQRRQSPNESIVHFFIVFEDDCSRLKDELPQAEKIKIIKKNVLQKYRPYIALTNFHSLNEIKESLKILEATMPHNNYHDSNRFKRYGSGDRLSNVSDNNTKNTHESRMDKFNNG